MIEGALNSIGNVYKNDLFISIMITLISMIIKFINDSIFPDKNNKETNYLEYIKLFVLVLGCSYMSIFIYTNVNSTQSIRENSFSGGNIDIGNIPLSFHP